MMPLVYLLDIVTFSVILSAAKYLHSTERDSSLRSHRPTLAPHCVCCSAGVPFGGV